MGLWATWSGGRCPCPWQGGWNQMIFKIPSNRNHSMIPYDKADFMWQQMKRLRQGRKKKNELEDLSLCSHVAAPYPGQRVPRRAKVQEQHEDDAPPALLPCITPGFMQWMHFGFSQTGFNPMLFTRIKHNSPNLSPLLFLSCSGATPLIAAESY